MQGEHWGIFVNSHQRLYFPDSLCRKKYSFLKQRYIQTMPAQLQSHSTVCGFFTTYAAFHLFKFRQDENTGVQEFDVLCFIGNYMYYFNVFLMNAQSLLGICSNLYSLIYFFKLSINLFTKNQAQKLSAPLIKYPQV